MTTIVLPLKNESCAFAAGIAGRRKTRATQASAAVIEFRDELSGFVMIPPIASLEIGPKRHRFERIDRLERFEESYPRAGNAPAAFNFLKSSTISASRGI